MEVTILKGKKNQKKKAQRCVIHPISSAAKGQTCPVYLIQKYLDHRVSLGHNGPNDYVFPLVGAKWQRVKPSYFVNIRVPLEKMSYDVYRSLLKRHLDAKALRELGVSPGDYSTHSFRKGGLSMLADGDMHPVYIQKSARHKSIESSVPYIESSLSKALKANDLLSGTDPTEGWSSRYSGNRKSLSRNYHLRQRLLLNKVTRRLPCFLVALRCRRIPLSGEVLISLDKVQVLRSWIQRSLR